MNDRNFMIHEAGALAVFCIALSVALFFAAAGTQKARNKALGESVAAVVERACGGEYKLGAFVPTKTPLSVSAAVYELEKANRRGGTAYAAVVRVTGFAGALPAVFVFDGEKAFFAGVCGGHLAAKQALPSEAELFNCGLNYKTLEFWQKRAQRLLPQAQGAAEVGQ